MMLQYSTYSVISPEGCASILWQERRKGAGAAETMGITAARLKSLGLIDKVVNEPLGGAHRDHRTTDRTSSGGVAGRAAPGFRSFFGRTRRKAFRGLMSYGRYKEQNAA